MIAQRRRSTVTEAIRHTLRMSSPPDDVDTVHGLLEKVWADAPGVAPMDRFSFETALIELASNVIRHADSGSGVCCTLTVEAFADRIQATLSDTGEPGDFQLVGHTMPDALSESGRGIPLIEALVDELLYNREGDSNLWRITRKFAS